MLDCCETILDDSDVLLTQREKRCFIGFLYYQNDPKFSDRYM